jgi:hypothetical protein
MEDDVAADMVMMWLLTWKEADMASDVAGDVAADISNTAHELNGPKFKVGLISAQQLLLANQNRLYTQPI